MILLHEFLSKEFIYDSLKRINRVLASRNLYMNLKVVGGAALIFNGIKSVDTRDVDTLIKLSQEIKDICSESSLDINDDVLDYIDNFENADFIEDTNKSFSNISILYLDLPYVVKTKLKNCQEEDKILKLAFLLRDELDVELTVDGISEFLIEYGVEPDIYDIEEYLNALEQTDYFYFDD